jgi:outer membrane protein TolC
MSHFHRAVLFNILLSIPFSVSLPAQESRTQPGEQPRPQFLGAYKPPAIRTLESRGDRFLESMIQEGKLRLTEADAVRVALESNVDINVERYSPYFTLWDIEKGRGVLNTSILFNTNVNRLVTPSTSVLQGGDTLLDLSSLYELVVHKPFEKGLDLDVNFSTRRARSSSFFSSLNPAFGSNFGLSLTQHLLKDFGSISRGRFVRIARNSYGMSEEEFVVRTTEIVNNVLNAYWDLVFTDEDIKTREASKKLAEVILEHNKIQLEVGTMSSLDVVQAEAEVAAREEELVVSRHTRRLTEDQLKKLISSNPDPGLITATIEPMSKPDPPPAPSDDINQAIRRALEIRPEVKQMLLDQENRKINVDYTRNQLRPTLDLVASYSQNGLGGLGIVRDYSQGFFGAPVIGTVPGGFFDSLESLFSQRFVGYTVGFNFRMPIGNDEARSNNAQAQISLKQGEERLRSLRQKVALEVRDAYGRFEMNRARVDAAQITVRFADKKLQGEQDKYNLGASTTRFVIEGQRDLLVAQNRLLQAKLDLIKSRIAVDKAVGDIFAAYNIELTKTLGLFK